MTRKDFVIQAVLAQTMNGFAPGGDFGAIMVKNAEAIADALAEKGYLAKKTEPKAEQEPL